MNETKSKQTAPREPRQTVRSRQSRTAKELAPNRLQLLFTVVNRKKAEFYADFLQSFEVNMQLTLGARGTASIETLSMLGLPDSEKSVIISVIKEERAAAALSALEEKGIKIIVAEESE